MRTQPASTASTASSTAARRGAAAAPVRRKLRAAAAGAPLHDVRKGALPSYCERGPAAMLDDGWISEPLDDPGELEALESADDVMIDFGDLEDSR